VDLFPGFARETVRTTGGADIHLRHGGTGPPLLLMHGWPQTHAMWHRVAPRLAEQFSVVTPDLRGYGDSHGPEPAQDGSNYTFREMARDQVEVMATLGHRRFLAAGHDRGARTLHRMLLDAPEAVAGAALIDILPGREQWDRMTAAGARRGWHWILLAQPYDLPERLLTSVPADWLLERILVRTDDEREVFSPAAWAEYLRCLTPKTIAGFCADYRAFADLDLAIDAEDEGRTVDCPLLLLYGERSYGQADMTELWARYATDLRAEMVSGAGHFLAEEAPEVVVRALTEFFGASGTA
jgi:haloacetate dehalogenase